MTTSINCVQMKAI